MNLSSFSSPLLKSGTIDSPHPTPPHPNKKMKKKFISQIPLTPLINPSYLPLLNSLPLKKLLFLH